MFDQFSFGISILHALSKRPDFRRARHWEALVAATTTVAECEDVNWRKRGRVFGSLLIMLFVLRLAVTPGGHGYLTIRIRLVRYNIGNTEYHLTTALLDSDRYGIQPLGDLYRGRWGVEELCKVGKDVIGDFHAKSERGVCREIYTAFVLLTMKRWLSNRCDSNLNVGGDESDMPAMRSTFKNGLRLVGKEIEALFLKQVGAVRVSVSRIMIGLSRCVQRERPGRSFPRKSKQPGNK